MHIKKSIISGFVLALGGILLAGMAILFCFTEIEIPNTVYIVSWTSCVFVIERIICKIER